MSHRTLEELFRDADPAKKLSPELLDRVAARMSSRRKLKAGRVSWQRLAVPAACVVSAAAAAAAVWGWTRAPQPQPPPLPAAAAGPAPTTPTRPPPARAEPSAAPLSRAAGVTSHRRPAALEPAAAPQAVPESPLLAESRLLGVALTQLRQDKDAAAALRTLDDYQRQFPRGTLHNEAAMARVDADLSLGRRDSALGVLESLELGADVPRASELTLLHAELLAEGNRCNEALPYFQKEATRARGELEERALYGLALCTHQRADFERYLQAYPSGRFAAAARHALGAP
jgi:hypothetical protein